MIPVEIILKQWVAVKR